MADQSKQPGRQRLAWYTLVAAALGWSVAAALGWSFFDASTLAEERGVGYLEAWSAAVAAGLKVAVVLSPLGLAVGWFWHRTRPGRVLRSALQRRPAYIGAILLAAVVGFVALSFATYGALTLYRSVFGSELVHKLALSISVPAAALLIGLAAYVSLGRLRALLERLGSPAAIMAVAGVVSLAVLTGWTVGLILLGKVVWQSLAPEIYLPFLIIGACSAIGALAAAFRRARHVALATALVAVPVAAFYMFGETSKDLRLALLYRDTGTGFVTKLTAPSASQSFAAAEFNRGKTAVCGPGVERPELEDVGRLGEAAPDIVWLTIDAIRWDHTTMAGHKYDTTPHIAEHSRDAAVFEQAYTPASSTRQTMRALFTGVHPSMIEPPRGPIYALTMAEEQHTLAEYMRFAGYHTAAWSSDAYIFSEAHGAMQGFAEIDEKPYDLKQDGPGYSAPYIIDEIIAELDENKGGQKFIWSHLIEAHGPVQVGPDPVEFGPDKIDKYDAALHFIDSEVARLLEFVAERQAEHPTYLIITADHGEGLGEHGVNSHGYTIFQAETHVPLIIWGPDIVPARYSEPVGVLDIFPTTFELAGLDVPPGNCGQSLAPVLRSERTPEPRPVYLEQVPDRSRTHFSVGFLRGKDKLVLQPSVDAISLIDLAEDPGEKNDLADEEPERLEGLLDELDEYWRTRGMNPSDYGLADDDATDP
ncbi:MAG: sulfatase-like hydrolase/transferase [Persicimonas sp.]